MRGNFKKSVEVKLIIKNNRHAKVAERGAIRIVHSSEVLEEQETSPERGSKGEDIDVPRGKGKLLPCRLLLLLSAPFLLLLSALELSLARPSSLNLSSTLCFSLSPGLNKLPSQAFNYATTMIRKCYLLSR